MDDEGLSVFEGVVVEVVVDDEVTAFRAVVVSWGAVSFLRK